VATKEVCGKGEARKEHTTSHKVTVYGGIQKFAATIEMGDLVAVSGPIYTLAFAGKNGKVETYAVRAHNLRDAEARERPPLRHPGRSRCRDSGERILLTLPYFAEPTAALQGVRFSFPLPLASERSGTRPATRLASRRESRFNPSRCWRGSSGASTTDGVEASGI
jgi:hypothetical protein